MGSANDEDTLRHAYIMSTEGDLAGALAVLENTATPPESDLSATDVEGQLLRVELLRRLGKLSRAEQALAGLENQINNAPDQAPELVSQVQRQTALLRLQRGDLPQAEAAISVALSLQDQLPSNLKAGVLNDAAVIRQKSGDTSGAIAQFTAAARQVSGQEAEAQYRINAARANLEDGRIDAFQAEADKVSRILLNSASTSATRYRIALAVLYREAVNHFNADPLYRLKALKLLQQAGRQTSVSRRSQSLLSGRMAELYMDDRQFNAALQFGRTALNAATQEGAVDLEYRWEWLLAQVFTALADPDAAMGSYARAIGSLKVLRSSLELYDQTTLNEVIKPLYYEYANLLLEQSTNLSSDAEKQTLLSSARGALEGLKLAEVENYFRQQCVGDETVLVDQLESNTAVLYPVLLQDRVEMLLTTDSGIAQFSVPVERAQLVALIRDFRLNIEVNNGSNDYLQLGQQLYNLLIRPLESALRDSSVDTLVLVPDGPLRTIPLSALHDGESYLIERFALATTPGLTLIDPKPFGGRSYAALAGGISESVQGFPALPGVNRELKAIEQILEVTVLENSAFTLDRAQSELKSGDYSIVHFATHGQFGGSYDDSFLLTYDDKLQINDLGRTILSRAGGSETLELLVLSACETAAGDDRAALGLAGVAFKAGARSALATLWEVDDQSALEIITEFYRSLSGQGDNKARSLQRAQVQLIRGGGNPHPSQWAPFLLIGNWL